MERCVSSTRLIIDLCQLIGFRCRTQTVKYGCISVDALCRDMLDWETLYISGRTQKPVSSRSSLAPNLSLTHNETKKQT